MDSASGDPLKPFAWFALVGEPRGQQSVLWASAKAGVGLLFGGFLAYRGLVAAGIAVCTIAAAVGAVSVVSRRGRIAVSAFFGALGQWIGRLLGIVLLTPLYLIAFSCARGWQRLCGADPLKLRAGQHRSYWLEADTERRKRRYVGTMFAAERLVHRRRRLVPAVAVVAGVVLAAELVLRVMGFGHPILYVNDPVIGYYPAPNQDVTRRGGRISTNRFGMRSPDYALQKPDGTYRVLLIGDSTLYGGSYIDQEETYARLLEQHLAELARPTSIEVLSIGVNAWGPLHKLEYIRRNGTFDADLAVVCMPIGDIYRPGYGLAAVPFFSVERPPRCAIEEFLGHAAWRYRTAIGGRPSEESVNEQGWRGTQAYVELAQLLRGQGCRVAFEILPGKTAGTGQPVPPRQAQAAKQLREALALEGFEDFSYPVSLFAGKGPPEELYHDECHLYHRGHRIYAAYLAERIGPQIARPGLAVDRQLREPMVARRAEDRSEHPRR